MRVRLGSVAVVLLGLLTALSAAGQPTTGLEALDRGDYPTARRHFEGALAEDPSSVEAWLGLAASAEGEGDVAAALRAARAAVDLATEGTPFYGSAQRALGRALVAGGRVAPGLEALANCRRALPTQFDCHLAAALVERDLGRGEAAIAILEEGLEAVGGGAGADALRRELGLLHLSAGAPEAALAAVAGPTTSGDVLLVRALSLAALPARREEAPGIFESALEAGAANEGRARLEYGRLLGELGRWQEATDQLRAASEQLPDEAQVWFRLGAALQQQGDGDGAARALERYRELEERDQGERRLERELGTTLNEAQQLAVAGKPAEAWARLDAAGEAGDEEPRFWVLRSKLLYAQGRADDARKAAGKAAALDPTDAEAVFLVASFSLASGLAVEAVTAAEHLLVMEPGFGEGWALLGSALARAGRLPPAAEAFGRALTLGFESSNLRQEYAAVLSDLERFEESREQLEALRALGEPTGDG